MSFISQISSLFSQKCSDHQVGIVFKPRSVTVCTVENDKNISSTSDDAKDSPKVSIQEVDVHSDDFSGALQRLKSDDAIIGECHLVLLPQQAQIVQVDKPNVPADEIVSALKWQIKDLVSISPDDMVLDYFDSPTLAGGKEKINVACASLSKLKVMVAAINQKKSQIKSITTQEFAFSHLLPTQNDAQLLVCKQPNEDVLLLIVKQGKLYFHRRLHGFAQLEKNSEEELALSIVDNLSLEIQRSTDYFERQLKQAPIKEIRVLIPSTSESFLARKLAENTNVSVSLLPLIEPYQMHREFALAIGATFFKNNMFENNRFEKPKKHKVVA